MRRVRRPETGQSLPVPPDSKPQGVVSTKGSLSARKDPSLSKMMTRPQGEGDKEGGTSQPASGWCMKERIQVPVAPETVNRNVRSQGGLRSPSWVGACSQLREC